MRNLLLFIFLTAFLTSFSQSVSFIDSSQSNTSFRGISVVSEKIVWVSGSKGTIGKSIDGGKTWQWVNPAGFEKRDFRDIEAFDENTAVVIAVDSPGIILKTKDAGKTWKVVYEDNHPGIFLDAIDFSGQNGFCVGDPIEGRFYLLSSKDAGNSWELLPASLRPEAAPGEACFAASGSNIQIYRENKNELPQVLFVSGGMESNLYWLKPELGKWISFPLSLPQGKNTTGANGLLLTEKNAVAYGGDFNNPLSSDSTFNSFTIDWVKNHLNLKSGYISGMAALDSTRLISCGLPGIFVNTLTKKQGRQEITEQHMLTNLPFHVVRSKNKVAFAAGSNGRIVKITW